MKCNSPDCRYRLQALALELTVPNADEAKIIYDFLVQTAFGERERFLGCTPKKSGVCMEHGSALVDKISIKAPELAKRIAKHFY